MGRRLGLQGVSGAPWRLFMAVMAVGLCLGAAACQPPAAIPSTSDIGVTVDEIVANPQHYTGRGVVVDAEVDRVVVERVIALRSQTLAQGVLAIVNDEALRAVSSIQAGDKLHVTGVVQIMSRDQLRQVEQQLGVQLDEDKLLNLANQAPFVVVATVSK